MDDARKRRLAAALVVHLRRLGADLVLISTVNSLGDTLDDGG